MPRLTFNNYRARHGQLRAVWLANRIVFFEVSAIDQWYLHDYYRPSEKLTEQELRTHWQALHNTPTSLHQQAGRAYARLKPFLNGKPYHLVPPRRRATSGKNAEVVAYGAVNPKLDVDLAVELVMMLGEQLRREADDSAN
jgi:hypothetical protein